MAIGLCAAMPGDMLEHRKHAALQHAIGHGAANPRHLRRIGAIAAVFQKGVRGITGDIHQRGAVAVDPQIAQFMRDQAIAQVHRLLGALARGLDMIERRQPVRAIAARAIAAPARLPDQW